MGRYRPAGTLDAMVNASELTPDEHALLRTARRGVLATIAPDGRPRLVPIAYAFAPVEGTADSTADSKAVVLYSALDEKPKSVDDPMRLARVRDVLERPQVTVLVDRWSEEWAALAWLRLDGTALVVQPAGDERSEHTRALDLLRQRYPQYLDQRLEDRPILRIEVNRASSWGLDR